MDSDVSITHQHSRGTGAGVSGDASYGQAPSIVIDKVVVDFGRPRQAPKRALDQVSLKLEPGEFLSLVGPSGCGKSTLMLLVAGLLAPTSGTVALDGRPVSKTPDRVGIVLQTDALLEWRTVTDNVLLAAEMKGLRRKQYRGLALDLLEMVGVGHAAKQYPSQLSGGMRQRVAICRALLLEPRLLLMDEPFGALDALTREQLQADLLNLVERLGTTTLFVTHSLEEAVLLSDRVVVLTPGPGRVRDVVPVDLPRPRSWSVRNDPVFDSCADRIRGHFIADGVLREQQ